MIYTTPSSSHMSSQDVQEITISNFLNYIQKKSPKVDLDTLRRSMIFAIEAHHDQFRKSGMPYAEHPVEVAKVLADYQVDTSTLVAALLHDVVEDTHYTLEDISRHFGSEVAFMVDAVTKISALQEESQETRMAETYRKLLTSMAKDPRILMIKIADRLHNMRTLHYINAPHKRKRIAQETLDLYAPLAHRFGLQKIKSELEDLSFHYTHPEQYAEVMAQLAESREEREAYVALVIEKLKKNLEKTGIRAQIQGRPKNIYSTWQKLKFRKCDIHELFDLFALRVVVEEKLDCFVALGVAHDLWKPIASRFKDYISCPKANLYQSLHTTVVGPNDRMLEIQIRTKQMDLTADKGYAAHWAYREKYLGVRSGMQGQVSWLEEMVQTQSDIEDSKEFLDFLKVDLKQHEFTCYTPQGDAIELPYGATVLDFAYAVHTTLGNKCVGGRINGQFVELESQIQEGATVHVLKSSQQTPIKEWLEIAKTHRAQTAIRKWLRQESRGKITSLGELLFQRELKRLQKSDHSLTLFSTWALLLQVQSWDDLYEKIGGGKINLREVREILLAIHGADSVSAIEPLVLENKHLLAYQFENCCHPVPGDELVGVLVPDVGVCVHREGCIHSLQMLENPKNLEYAVIWDENSKGEYEVSLEILAKDRGHLLADITQVFNTFDVNVLRASIVTAGDRVRDRFRIRVSSLSQLNSAISELSKLDSIERVNRN